MAASQGADAGKGGGANRSRGVRPSQTALWMPCGSRSDGAAFGQRLDGRDEIPVALIVGEIAESFIRIEEQVFFPFVCDAFVFDAARLEADDLPCASGPFAALPEGNLRRAAALRGTAPRTSVSKAWLAASAVENW